MKISILLPTRERVNPLIATIKSLLDNFSQQNEIEILLRFDNDDLDTVKKVKQIIDKRIDDEIVKYFIGIRYGWPWLHRYYNELASEAKGEWLMLMNDDILMQTKDWDMEIEKYNERMVFLSSSSVTIFPRKIFDIWGHISLSLHCDNWIYDIGEILKIGFVVNIHVLHDRADLTGNNKDAMYESRKYETNYRTPQNDALRAYDAMLLKRYIENLKKSKKETIDDIFASVPGMIEKNIATYLYDMASKVKKGAIVEIGGYYGLSTICIAKGSRSGYNTPVYSVDPQNGNGFTPDPEWNVGGSLGIPNEKYYVNVGINLSNFKQRLKQFDVDDIVIPLVGYSEQIYKRGWDIDIGMLFIDGDPRYNYVKMDMETFGKHVISGGIIIFHDDTPGVRTVIDEMIANNPKYDIIRGDIFSTIVR